MRKQLLVNEINIHKNIELNDNNGGGNDISNSNSNDDSAIATQGTCQSQSRSATQ